MAFSKTKPASFVSTTTLLALHPNLFWVLVPHKDASALTVLAQDDVGGLDDVKLKTDGVDQGQANPKFLHQRWRNYSGAHFISFLLFIHRLTCE